MGIKRLNRSRLYNIEKKGIDVGDSIGISDVMKNALVYATQQREGYKVITDICLDLGAAAAALNTQALHPSNADGSTPGKSLAIGTTTAAANKSHICRTVQSVFGIVSTVETICLEGFADEGAFTNLDMLFGDDGDARLANADSNPNSFASNVQENIADVAGKHTTSTFDDNELANGSGRYVYFACGAAQSKRASATITLTDAVAGNLVSGMSAIQVQDADGTGVNFVADVSIPWDDATPAANKFGIGDSVGAGTPSASTAQRITYAISNAINRNANFATDAASQLKTGGANNNCAEDNATVIVVTHAKSGGPKTTENAATITIVDAYSSLNATASAFSGGPPYSVSSGKILVRFTGFLEPADI